MAEDDISESYNTAERLRDCKSAKISYGEVWRVGLTLKRKFDLSLFHGLGMGIAFQRCGSHMRPAQVPSQTPSCGAYRDQDGPDRESQQCECDFDQHFRLGYQSCSGPTP